MSATSISQATLHAPSAIQRKKTPSQWVSEHNFLLNLVTLGLVIMIVVSYILQVTGTVAKGYELRDLEVEIHQLTLENERMEVIARQSQSLEHVAKSVKMLGLVRAEQPTYIQSGEPSYAMAK
ncbi:hypothetical protein HOI18_00780 [Candidatus Uhrbacteria bacterium]|jgi:hypothetical protein|nr:hypothetical protein [Candidatus Uhrbacteria bacterium]